MGTADCKLLGQHLAQARRAAGLTQTALAAEARINRVQIVRMEAGETIPRLDEALCLAGALKVPLEWLTAGRKFPRPDLKGIAVELHHLGIRDLEVSDAHVPGSFRHGEEVLVIALSGDRPEPRIVEAIPFLLARLRFRASLATAFAEYYDRRVRTRLAWLCDITLALSRLSTMPVSVESEANLKSLIKKGVKAAEPDSLGYPSSGKLPPIWRRWNITYAGTMDDFLRRTIEVHTAFRAIQTLPRDEA